MSTAHPGSERAPAILRLRRLLVRGSFALLLLALLLEGGARLALWATGQAYSRTQAQAEARALLADHASWVPEGGAADELPVPEDFARRPESRPELHPYLGFHVQGEQAYLEDQIALFGDAGQASRDWILVLGGSVSQIFGQEGMPVLLRHLRQDERLADRRYTTLLCGRGGYKQPQQALFLTWLLSLGARPDLVLLLDGFNEVALGTKNAHFDVHPAYPSFAHFAHLTMGGTGDPQAFELALEVRAHKRELERAVGRILDGSLSASALWGRWHLSRAYDAAHQVSVGFGAYSQYLASEASSEVARGPRDRRWEEQPTLAAVRIWQNAARSMHVQLAALDVPLVHVLQPTLHDPGAKPISAEERAQGAIDPHWLEGVEAGYPLLRQAGERMRAEGVRFVDASRVFAEVEETLYFDSCHFDARGCELLADFLAPHVAQALAER